MGYRYVVKVLSDAKSPIPMVGWLAYDSVPTFARQRRGSWGNREGAEAAAVLAAAKRPHLIGRLKVSRRPMEEVVHDSGAL